MLKGSSLVPFAFGLVGVATGSILSILIASATLPERPSELSSLGRTVGRLERSIRELEHILSASRAPERDTHRDTPAHAETDSTDADPGALPLSDPGAIETARARQSQRLRSLVARPTDEDALRRLSMISGHMMETYALWTYEDILEEFGRPSFYNVREGKISFHYTFTDADEEGRKRDLSFSFHDGLVFRLDAR